MAEDEQKLLKWEL